MKRNARKTVLRWYYMSTYNYCARSERRKVETGGEIWKLNPCYGPKKSDAVISIHSSFSVRAEGTEETRENKWRNWKVEKLLRGKDVHRPSKRTVIKCPSVTCSSQRTEEGKEHRIVSENVNVCLGEKLNGFICTHKFPLETYCRRIKKTWENKYVKKCVTLLWPAISWTQICKFFLSLPRSISTSQ